ncbi:alpha/beta fold hydrolase [Palleronia sp. LCG004]|uniref:alpha/beta fold hydrolase n=1 Tax=Palleronia sp. LCG004 TaxID=3079304 RepID=UPI00294215B7|nr:alpha/beta fold hydrolase [Palleronia sp. LCG004]WOI56806.1 alpha/beta fold hydrolase [Palleronia sp. LCG004]
MPGHRTRIEVEGRDAAFVDCGPAGGVPVVLLHGAGFDHARLTWRLATRDLARDRRVIVPDLPGYGATDAIAGPHDLERLGRWLVAFLDRLGLGQVDMAGLSMGGGMALWLALERHERIRRLVPVAAYGLMGRLPFHPLAHAAAGLGAMGAAYGASRRSALATRLGLAASFAVPNRVTLRTVAEVMDVARDQSNRRSFDAFLAAELGTWALRSDLSGRLPEIGRRTLVIHGRSDRIVPVRYARRAARLIPHAEYLELPTGHWPMRELPDRFNAALRGFLDAS